MDLGTADALEGPPPSGTWLTVLTQYPADTAPETLDGALEAYREDSGPVGVVDLSAAGAGDGFGLALGPFEARRDAVLACVAASLLECTYVEIP